MPQLLPETESQKAFLPQSWHRTTHRASEAGSPDANQNSNMTVVTDKSGNLVEVQGATSTFATDGTFTVGSGVLQVGADGRNYVVDLSLPVGRTTSYGVTIKLNINMVRSVATTIGSFLIFKSAPVYRPVIYGF